ncbi:PRA1 family protein F3-like protein, partial [Tanacetum coccineum]
MTSYGTIPTSSHPIPTTNLEYLSRAKDQLKTSLATRRPWAEMFNFTSFNLPHTISESYPRLKTNIAYFRMNYAIIVLLILFLSLLWHPVSLIVFVILMAAWLFLYFLRDEPLVIANREINDWVVLVVLFGVTIILLLFTGVKENVLVSVLIGLVFVVVHGVVRRT